MRLELRWLRVEHVVAGSATRLSGPDLEVDLDGLRARLAGDGRLSRVQIELAHPGERCRIGRVLDVIAPRAKLDGRDFPGVLTPLARVGDGPTLALGGVAVVITDQQAQATGALAVIDMDGPGAALSEFARTHNVVISAWPAPGIGTSEYLAAVRLAGLKAAVYLAQTTRDVEPESVETFDLPAPTRAPAELSHLPRVAYVCQIH